MNTQDVIDSWFAAFAKKDMEAVGELLADDVIFDATNLPNPLIKAQILGFYRTLHAAFPDIQFNYRAENVGDGTATLIYQLTGTHTEVLKLTAMGMKDFAPTGKSFSLPDDAYKMTIKDGKVTHVAVDPPEGAGLGGVLVQLGLA
jgi:ketosteroid isomerase-like protein